MGETVVIANEHANWRASRAKVRRALEPVGRRTRVGHRQRTIRMYGGFALSKTVPHTEHEYGHMEIIRPYRMELRIGNP